MNRTIVTLAALILLAGGAAARGQWDKYDPAVKKLMPKDQREIVERMEVIAEQHKTLLFRIKDAKKRGEENEKLAAQAREVQEAVVKKLQTEGLTGWVGVCNIIMPDNAVILDTLQPFITNIRLSEKGKPVGEAERALRSIKINDVVRFSTKADPTYAMPPAVGKGFGSVIQEIKIGSLTAAEKVATRSPSTPPAKAPPARRKKP
jgi:hypothetical protein